MEYCENCGSKVFSLGCINCNEKNYIEEQIFENRLIIKKMSIQREIKFRAWDGFNEEMLKPDDVIGNKKDLSWFFSQFDEANKGGNNLVLMQFTGLKDKNGKEIYEGDVINGASYNGSYCYGKVVFNNGQFVAWPIPKFTEGQNEFAYILNKIEVIGNIYEDAELLK